MREHRPERDKQLAEQDSDDHRGAGRNQHRDYNSHRDVHGDRDCDGYHHADAGHLAVRGRDRLRLRLSGSGSSLIWLWILLGVAVLAGLIALITHSARRRSAASAGWQSRLIDVYSKGSALHDAMSVAETPGQLASGNASARWADIQRRADDLTQTLYSLRETVPDDGDRIRIEDTLTSLQAVRSAMDAERAQGGADPQQAEVVRNRLYSFEMSLRALREGGQELS